MKVKINSNFTTANKEYKKGQVVEVKDQEALALIKVKLADKVDDKAAKAAADKAKADKEAADKAKADKEAAAKKAATPETATTDTKSEKATTTKK